MSSYTDSHYSVFLLFFFHAPAPPDIYTLSLHDALPISHRTFRPECRSRFPERFLAGCCAAARSSPPGCKTALRDRKSTRLNSSHRTISYAVFCLKKKKNIKLILCSFSIRSLMEYIYIVS